MKVKQERKHYMYNCLKGRHVAVHCPSAFYCGTMVGNGSVAVHGDLGGRRESLGRPSHCVGHTITQSRT